MKKMKFCFLVLLASFVLVFQSFGQENQSDSVKTDLNLSSDVVKKLDSKDIVEIVKYKEKLVQDRITAEKFAVDPSKFMESVMPSELTMTIGTILLFAFILSLLAIPFYFNLKKSKGRQQIINSLIEKDKEIPKELLLITSKTGRSDFHKGIILIALGLSVSIVLMVLKIPNNYWTIGLIPMFIGIGYLISFKFDSSSKKKSEIE